MSDWDYEVNLGAELDPFGLDSFVGGDYNFYSPETGADWGLPSFDEFYEYPGEPYIEGLDLGGVPFMSEKALADMAVLARMEGQTQGVTPPWVYEHLNRTSGSDDPFATTAGVNKDWYGETLGYLPTQAWQSVSNRPVGSGGSGSSRSSSRGILDILAGMAAKVGQLRSADKMRQQSQKDTQTVRDSRSPSFYRGLQPKGSLGKPTQTLLSALSQQSTRQMMPGGAPMYSPDQAADARMRNAQRVPMARGGYIPGVTPGQADKIPALLSDGEYVIDAETVAMLGDGNNAAGAAALEQMRQNIRRHKRSAPTEKIAPKAKAPESYMKR